MLSTTNEHTTLPMKPKFCAYSAGTHQRRKISICSNLSINEQACQHAQSPSMALNPCLGGEDVGPKGAPLQYLYHRQHKRVLG